jgi:hypothetical protein
MTQLHQAQSWDLSCISIPIAAAAAIALTSGSHTNASSHALFKVGVCFANVFSAPPKQKQKEKSPTSMSNA